MNNSEQLVGVIKSILGEKAANNTLAIKVAQKIVEHDFEIGQKLAELIFNPNNNQSQNDMMSYYESQKNFDSQIEAEIAASKTDQYLEQRVSWK